MRFNESETDSSSRGPWGGALAPPTPSEAFVKSNLSVGEGRIGARPDLFGRYFSEMIG